MDNGINRLTGLNVTGYNYTRSDEAAAGSTPEKKTNADASKHKQVGAENVQNYYAAAFIDMKPASVQRTVDVRKYVTEADEARIAASMQVFQTNHQNAHAAVKTEFPWMSDEEASSIALAMIET